MKVTLVRHGETEENYLNKIQGISNNLLNDTGRRQCQRLRNKFKNRKFDYCYMSPLVRTVETAMILIGDRVEMIPDNRLIERDVGELEGIDACEYDYLKYWDYKLNCSDFGVEKIQDVFNRCRDFLNYILTKHEDQDILIVSHSSIIRVFSYLLSNYDLNKKIKYAAVDNCYFKEFIIKDEKELKKTLQI